METARNIWNPRLALSEGENMIERRAAGVVQQTNKITMEINTSTSILSSALWRDFRLVVREICLSRTGLRFRRDSEEVYKRNKLGEN